MKLPSLSFQLHRWLGLAFGIFGLVWFASVVPMSVFDYWFTPDITVQLRSYGAPLTPMEVEASTFFPDRGPKGEKVRNAALYRRDDQLVWRLDLAPRGTAIVDAANGRKQEIMTAAAASRIAERALATNADVASARQFTGFTFYWTVPASRKVPPYRVIFDDAQATDVFVEPATGDLERVFGTRERLYRIGRTPHILRFPPFDDDRGAAQVVRVLLLTGLLLATIAGFVYGVWYVSRKRRPEASLAEAPKGRRRGRWLLAQTHMWVGISIFAIVLSWTGSGFVMLLADESRNPTSQETARMIGDPLQGRDFPVRPSDALRRAAEAGGRPVMLLRAKRLLDQPVYEARHADGRVTLIDGATGAVLSPLSEAMVTKIANRFTGRDGNVRGMEVLNTYDAYYYSMHKTDPLPLPVYRVQLDTHGDAASPSRLYVDADTGEVQGRVNRAYQWYRWLGRAPHTFDFPWLIAHPPARMLAVAIPGVAGTVLSISGLWLGCLHLWKLATSRRRTAHGRRVVRASEVA